MAEFSIASYGSVYRVVPYDYEHSFSLNINGNSVVSNNRNVNLYSSSTDLEQGWILKKYTFADGTSGQVLASNLNQNYALDWYYPNDNCDIYQQYNNTDSNLRLVAGNDSRGRFYYIINVNSGKYLTVDATIPVSGSNVIWATHYSSDARQRWRFMPFNSTPNGIRTVISMPTDTSRNPNWSQHHAEIEAIAGNAGCSLTTLVDVANIFGPTSFSPAQVRAACGWGSSGIQTWVLPSSCNGSIDASGYQGGTSHSGRASSVCSVVKAEVNKNNPVIIKFNKNGATHFALAYGYTGTCTSFNDILVFDPETNGNLTHIGTTNGHDITLSQAETNCGKTVFDYLKTVRS